MGSEAQVSLGSGPGRAGWGGAGTKARQVSSQGAGGRGHVSTVPRESWLLKGCRQAHEGIKHTF